MISEQYSEKEGGPSMFASSTWVLPEVGAAALSMYKDYTQKRAWKLQHNSEEKYV